MAEVKKKKRKRVNHLFLSVIALVEILVLLMNVTYSWLPEKEGAKLDAADGFSITADSGLRISYGDDYSGNILLKDYVLEEASSTDGKNMFFPTVGRTGNTTNTMKFRKGTVNDANTKYISVNFTMRADAGAANVWFDPENTYVKYKGTEEAATAVRVAFYENNGKDAQVFAPGLSKKEQKTSPAVVSADANGTPTTGTASQVAKSFAANYFVNETTDTALFKLRGNEVKYITMIIWLEGTDPDCTADISGEDLDLHIKFSSEKIAFVQTIRIFFEDRYNWYKDGINIYYWFENGEINAPYPGVDMKSYNGSTRFFYMDIPEDTYGIVISRGKTETLYNGYKIESNLYYTDINDPKYGILIDNIIFYRTREEQGDPHTKEWYFEIPFI